MRPLRVFWTAVDEDDASGDPGDPGGWTGWGSGDPVSEGIAILTGRVGLLPALGRVGAGLALGPGMDGTMLGVTGLRTGTGYGLTLGVTLAGMLA